MCISWCAYFFLLGHRIPYLSIVIKLKKNSPQYATSSLISPFCDTCRPKRELLLFFFFFQFVFFSSFLFGVSGSRISWIFWLFIGHFYLFLGPYFDICGPFVFRVRCAIFSWSTPSPSIVLDSFPVMSSLSLKINL